MRQAPSATAVSSGREPWIAGVVLFMTALRFGLYDSPIGEVIFYDATLVFLGIVGSVIWLRKHGASFRRSHAIQLAIAAFVVSTLISSRDVPEAVRSTFHFLGGVTLCVIVSACMQQRNIVVFTRTLCLFVSTQFCLALAQVIRNGPIGWSFLDEQEVGFRRVNGVAGPIGSLYHTNQLAYICALIVAILLVVQAGGALAHTDRWIVGITTCFGVVIIGLSFSRTGLLTLLVPLPLCVVSKQRKRLIPTLVCTVFALGLTIGFRHEEWSHRATGTTTSVEAAGSGRMALIRQSIALFKLEPVRGVGPNRYIETVAKHPDISALSTEQLAVHNAWLHVLATQGVLGIAAFASLGGLILFRGKKGGVLAVALLFSSSIPLLLDSAFIAAGFAWIASAIGVSIGVAKLTAEDQNQLVYE